MKKLGLILVATFMGGVALSAPSLATVRSFEVRHEYSQRPLINREWRQHGPATRHIAVLGQDFEVPR
jgi:hypothetical protein